MWENTIHEQEFKKRLKFLETSYNNQDGNIELKVNEMDSEISDNSLENSSIIMITEGYMEYFEIDFMSKYRDFSEDESENTSKQYSEKENINMYLFPIKSKFKNILNYISKNLIEFEDLINLI